jgi:Right handed beta helix region
MNKLAMAAASCLLLALVGPLSGGTAGAQSSCVTVRPGDNISSVINKASSGKTFCIQPGTYHPTSSILPKDGDNIKGMGTSPDSVVISTTSLSIIFDLSDTTGVHLTNLAITGAVNECPGTNCGPTGEGVYGGANVTASQLHVYSNGRVGLGGQNGLVVSNSHIDHNGWVSTAQLDYVSAGIKSVNPLTVTDSQIDHNYGNGVHCDRNCGAFTITNSVVEYNSITGIHYEIGQGPAKIANNTVRYNNTLDKPHHAGIQVNSSQNVDIYGNTLGGNGNMGIHVWNDTRAGTTGFYSKNITIHNNYAHGDLIGICSTPGVTCG